MTCWKIYTEDLFCTCVAYKMRLTENKVLAPQENVQQCIVAGPAGRNLFAWRESQIAKVGFYNLPEQKYMKVILK